MKVLVIGATGQTGRHALKQLPARGHEVAAFARTPSAITEQSDRLRVVQGDARDIESIDRAVRGQDAVLVALGPRSLKKNDVQAADLFTTDPAIAANSFVVLEDPKNLFGAQNVTPLVNTAVLNDTITTTLNAISAKLDTATLADLLKKVVSDKEDADKVAGDWLKSVGLA